MDLITEPGVSEDPAAEWAPSHALLRLCADGRFDSLLRIHRPSVPMVVFGRRDTRLPGYPRALQAARDEGFTPAIRAAGGRVVAYTDQALVVDEVRREPGAVRSQEQRFERSAFASSKCSASSEWTRGWVRFLVSTVLAPIRSTRAAAASWSVLPSGSCAARGCSAPWSWLVRKLGSGTCRRECTISRPALRPGLGWLADEREPGCLLGRRGRGGEGTLGCDAPGARPQ